MAVPAHDERDFEFADKYGIEKIKVIENDSSINEEVCFTGYGKLTNSEEFDGLTSQEAKTKIVEKVGGKMKSQYKLREWVFARQRYWGEPFPIVFDENHKSYAVADSELPVVLPQVDDYEPTGTGESPLANIKEFTDVYGHINSDGEFVSLPKENTEAKLFRRETNTMPQWAGSSWYYLRFIDPQNNDVFADKDKEAKWSPVDFYVGGAEHATRHLIYARFWHKFLFDLGLVSTDEPFLKLQTVGLIMAEDGRKMSKRWGNIINPDDIIREYGADTLRLYEMFMGPFDQAVAWNMSAMSGVKRFLERFVRLSEKIDSETISDKNLDYFLNLTIKKVTEDIEKFKFNTAISQMMILLNEAEKYEKVSSDFYLKFVKIISPFTPFLAEELYVDMTFANKKISIREELWPVADLSKLEKDLFVYAVQVNGKLRGEIEVSKDIKKEDILKLAREQENVKKWLDGETVKKEILIEGKLVNFVI